jgi:hypothetical protein
MAHWLQLIVVGVAVLVSALYAAYVLMPSAWRTSVDAVLGGLLPESWRRRRAARLSGCAGCVNNPAAPRPETRVHVHHIERRG